MKHYFLFFLYTITVFYTYCWNKNELATTIVITQPVVDFFIESASRIQPQRAARETYTSTAIAPYKNDYSLCYRCHQGLFNECYTLLSRTTDEIELNTQMLFYGVHPLTEQKLSTFWTLARNGQTLQELKKQGIDITAIPYPKRSSKNLILIFPWHNDTTHTTFSAGTRFVRASSYDNESQCAIRCIDFKQKTTSILFIPRALCRIEEQQSFIQKRKNFIDLLTQWTDQSSGIIPYVWGGSSFTNYYENIPATLNKNNGRFSWSRPEKYTPHRGFDCSELIYRAAHIAGITYPYKTTGVAQQFLPPFTPADTLEEGDLFWIPGHIMVISSLKNNELIEACGYKSGYGKVQRIPLARRFAGIKSYDDLLKAYFAKQPLKILNKAGEVMETYKEFKILKLKEPS